MNSLFYDINLTYEKNYELGPVNLKKLKVPNFKKSKKKFKFLGLDVNIPFGIAAGPLLNSKFVKSAFDFGFDVNHYKTQRSVVFPYNQFPNILFVDIDGNLTLAKAEKPLIGRRETRKKPTKITITNSFGNPCRGPEVWQRDMKKALSYVKSGQLLIGSVVGTIQKGFTEGEYFDDFAYTATLAKETGIKIIEINLSCPNVTNEGVLCYSQEACEKIVRKTKEAIGNTPLLVKVGYYSHKQEELLEVIIKKIAPFASGIAAINTIPAPVINLQGKQALPGPNRLKSGICGYAIKWAAIDMVKRLSLIREKLKADYAIIGVGGVMTPEDYREFRKAGADLVQSATGAMWNPYLAYEIWKLEQKKQEINE